MKVLDDNLLPKPYLIERQCQPWLVVSEGHYIDNSHELMCELEACLMGKAILFQYHTKLLGGGGK